MKNALISARLTEVRKKKRRARVRRAAVAFFLLVLVLSGLSFSLEWDKINVREVRVFGNRTVQADSLLKVAEEMSTGKRFFIFPKSNFLLYPRGKIKREIMARHREVASVDFDLAGFQTINMSVREREPAHLWCGILPNKNSEDEKCFFMDEGGYIFAEAPRFSGEVYFKYYGSRSGENFPYGFFSSAEDFGRLETLRRGVARAGLSQSGLYLDQAGDVRVILASATGSRPEVIFPAGSDWSAALANLEAAVLAEPLRSGLKDRYDLLLYIDLRFGEKVFYKFR